MKADRARQICQLKGNLRTNLVCAILGNEQIMTALLEAGKKCDPIKPTWEMAYDHADHFLKEHEERVIADVEHFLHEMEKLDEKQTA